MAFSIIKKLAGKRGFSTLAGASDKKHGDPGHSPEKAKPETSLSYKFGCHTSQIKLNIGTYQAILILNWNIFKVYRKHMNQ